ncbi:hypothetical protein [Halosegnis sp.]|uniref:hypothetical protein n=1 Tax=Halosegnis sp. TaxID=2864959 RepID=UPI0035D5024F
MTHRRAAVALALLCLAAGCGETATGGGVDETLTPATVPEPTPAPVDRVPGLGKASIVDERALVTAHRAGLAETSYQLNRERRVVGPNGTLDVVTVNASVAGGDAYRVSRVERSAAEWYTAASSVRRDVWYRNGHLRNRYVDADREATYWGSNGVENGPVSDPTRARLVMNALGAVRFRVTDATRVNGTVRYRLAGTGRTDRELTGAPSLLIDIRNRSLTATIRADGVVLAYTLRYEATFKQRAVWVEERYTVSRLGRVRITRPSWLAAANETVTG